MNDLYWRSDSLEKLMRRNKISDRRELASAIQQPYSTVCENLSVEWAGRVKTFPVLVSMCKHFHVGLASVVVEPKEQRCVHEQD